MPGLSLPNVTPGVVRTISGPMIVGLFLPGCAGFSVVPGKALEAERQQRRELKLKQQKMLEKLERDLQEQQSTAGRLKRLEAKWGQWREQDLGLQLEVMEAVDDGDANLYLLLQLFCASFVICVCFGSFAPCLFSPYWDDELSA